MKLNFEEYKSKVYACWTGKNIGGTIGGPYEGKREILNVTGFTTKPGAAPQDGRKVFCYHRQPVREGARSNGSQPGGAGTSDEGVYP